MRARPISQALLIRSAACQVLAGAAERHARLGPAASIRTAVREFAAAARAPGGTQVRARHCPAVPVGTTVRELPAAAGLAIRAHLGARPAPAIPVRPAIREARIGARAAVERVVHGLHELCDVDHTVSVRQRSACTHVAAAERDTDADDDLADRNRAVAVAIAHTYLCSRARRIESHQDGGERHHPPPAAHTHLRATSMSPACRSRSDTAVGTVVRHVRETNLSPGADSDNWGVPHGGVIRPAP